MPDPESPTDSQESVAGAGLGRITPAAELSSFALDEAYHSISKELGHHAQIEGFLEAAEVSLAGHAVEMIRKLGTDAVRAAADRSGATAIDKCDVDHAYRQVSGQNAAQKAWLVGVAGGLAGGATTAFVGVMLTPPTSHATIWQIAIGLFGVAALVLFYLAFPRKSKTA
jgi:hypothetical protein